MGLVANFMCSPGV